MPRTVPLLALITAMLVAGCSTGADDQPGASDAITVGVLFPGSLSDDGFMESAYLGYQRAEQTHAGKVTLSKAEQVATADYEAALVRFASNADLVISLGGQTDAAVRLVAPRFPQVKFVEIGGPADGTPLANLALYDPQQAQAAYLAGAASALLSKTKKVGFVGGAELPAIVNAAREFGNGAAAADPAVQVLTPQYVGDFNDVAKAKQSALADYSAGADVLGQIVNLGKKGMAQAAAQERTTLIGGPIPHDCGSDPAYAGFVTTDIGAEIEYAVEHLTANTWKAESVKFGLSAAKPHNDITLCAADPAIQAKLDAIKADVASGKTTTL
ncbi:BMP family ABC transporter substrate-binding protein [Actinoplanes ianthinogenes]|uniref:BMP family ABC transporter substrate-binding protein n=1 Tax=Actinoplanes ianthinogenes TaxID=122358 RepID=A0ABN6C9Q3_9ACTN|nr:BMP family ABC transporter substrate-binding protein [Actinoplanes ianthinogenes]BCJ41421.1 BMP family ABC transporter substrate-binding protein [Actinoplanes ianthinogenes]GGR30233.1 BMP family ABC transporter substrate-binding protein [Actinoplanes ianthinogenes]